MLKAGFKPLRGIKIIKVFSLLLAIIVKESQMVEMFILIRNHSWEVKSECVSEHKGGEGANCHSYFSV